MLQMRILSKFLPQNYDQLENFVAPVTYLPLNNDQKGIQVKNQRYKMIQEAKRLWLNTSLNVYEIKLQQYEEEYRYALTQFESQLSNNNTVNGASLLKEIQEYLNGRTEKLKKNIYKKLSALRGRLLQNRQRSSATKNAIGVSPEPYLDLISNPFNTRQWNQLSLGKIVFS